MSNVTRLKPRDPQTEALIASYSGPITREPGQHVALTCRICAEKRVVAVTALARGRLRCLSCDGPMTVAS